MVSSNLLPVSFSSNFHVIINVKHAKDQIEQINHVDSLRCLHKADFESLVPELLNDLDPNDEAQALQQKRDQILAGMACHGAVFILTLLESRSYFLLMKFCLFLPFLKNSWGRVTCSEN